MFHTPPNLVPIDLLRETQMFIFQDGNRSGIDPFQRSKPQRFERGLDDVKRCKIVVKHASADNLQVSKIRQIGEGGMIGLDVQKPGDFLQGAEHLQPIWMHGRVAIAETQIGEEVLVAGEGIFEDVDVSFDDGAALKTVDIARVYLHISRTSLWARSVARHALPVHRLFVGRAGSHTGTVILQ